MSAILSLQETGLRRPQDLVGKTLADSPASTVRVLFPLYAKKAGIDVSKVSWRDAAPPALPALLAAKQVDGIGQFSVGVPLVSRAAGGKKIRTFKYSKVLPGLLGIGIVASDEKIRTSPGEVRAFTRALLRGLRYAIDNPGEAGTILRKHQPLADPVVAAQELRIMKFFVQNRLTRQRQNGLGYIDVPKFNATASVIRNGFRLSGPLNAAETWSPVAVNVRRAGR
jgi:NitT/TauT family transport system substrate-binding protein